MSAYAQAVGQRITDRASACGLDAAGLAARSGVRLGHVEDVMAGREWPCPRVINAISHALNVQPNALIPGPEEL